MTTLSKFVGSIAGLDNTLRLVQSVTLIVSSRTGLPKWTTAFEQLDYVRRPLRMFGWLGCWEAARAESLSNRNSLKTNLQCLKMSFLGLFLFTEMFVLPFSMQLVSGPLGPKLQQEAFKFWAYSLCFSIISHLIALREGPPPLAPPQGVGKKSSPEKQPQADTSKRLKIWKDLFVDSCDLIIPAVTVGWIDMDPSLLGVVIFISTIGAGSDIWRDCEK